MMSIKNKEIGSSHTTIATTTTTTTNNDLSTLRMCYVKGDADGMLGLHLSRAPWDPYPWISGVQNGSSAHEAGIHVGDCVIEVNGVDVLGQKIVEVAEKIRSNWKVGTTNDCKENGVTFLLWNSKCDQNNLNPQSLQKFTTCLQNVAQLLECPVCLEVIKPPAWQCCHGHVLCSNCRTKSQRCPICRVTLGPRGRCLIADQLFTLLAETFPCDARNENRNNNNCKSSKSTCASLNNTTNNNNGKTSSSSSSSTSSSPANTTTKNTINITNKNPLSFRKMSTSNVENENNNIEKSIGLTISSLALFKFNCPTGKSSCARMASQHELLVHLQKIHKTTITQYYCNFGDKVSVQFFDRSLVAVVIPKNNKLELFLVVKCRSVPANCGSGGGGGGGNNSGGGGDSGNIRGSIGSNGGSGSGSGSSGNNNTSDFNGGEICWIWYVGGQQMANTYCVRMEVNKMKWRGSPLSLECGLKDVLKSARYATCEDQVTSLSVEIK